jgi:hypothetical protein
LPRKARIRITFLYRKTFKNKEGNHPIVLRLIYRSKRKDIFTGLFCNQDQWDRSKKNLLGEIGPPNSLNAKLDFIRRSIFEVLEAPGKQRQGFYN